MSINSKYDNQFVLSLVGSHDGQALRKKGNKFGLKTQIIDLLDNPDLSLLKAATQQSRIYLNGHSWLGEELYEDHAKQEPKGKTPEEFVDIITKNAPQLKSLTSAAHPIKICVIGCNSAGDNRETGKKSFAERLSQVLDKEGIHAVVHGYNGTIKMGMDDEYDDLFQKKWKTVKLINGQHHEKDGYKSSFVTENGKTVRYDFRKSECEGRNISWRDVGLSILGAGILLFTFLGKSK